MLIKYFNVSTVGIVCSLMPLFVCVMAYFMLGERMKTFDWVSLGAVIGCVGLVIFGADGEEKSAMQTNTLATIALIAQPMLLAGGTITMRQMRKMPETLVSTYLNIALALMSAGALWFQGQGLSWLLDFNLASWILLILTAAMTILSQTIKFNAFRYSEASKLQKLNFLPNVW